MDFKDSYIPHLAEEVIRKLRLATAAETKDDLEIICEELFSDVTGLLSPLVQDKLGLDKPTCFYEVLAPYYLKTTDSAEALLHICRKLWHQPYIASIYALLLHQWLLIRKEAGGWEQRQKHINVLVLGARDTFFGDVLGGRVRFESMFNFLLDAFILASDGSPLLSLPQQSRTAVLAMAAGFLPFYVTPQRMCAVLSKFPSPAHLPTLGSQQEGEGADFVLWEVAHMLHRVRTETGILRYLAALRALAGTEAMRSLRRTTSMLLQYEIFVLTKPGGPGYAPKVVHQEASETLDRLFPRTRFTRRAVHLLFSLWLIPIGWGTRLYAAATRSVLGLLLQALTALRGLSSWSRGWHRMD